MITFTGVDVPIKKSGYFKIGHASFTKVPMTAYFNGYV